MRFHLLISALALCAISVTADKESLEKISKGGNVFNANLFKELANKTEGKNLVSSPLSAHVVLSMVAQGAKGVTAEQMVKVLNLPEECTRLKGFHSLLNDLNNVKNVTLEIANNVLIAKDMTLKEDFKSIVKTVFRSEVGELDVKDKNKTVKAVNDWVDEKTHHKIKELITPEFIDDNTRMVLLNAVYFKGKWAMPFKSELTTDLPFVLADNKTVNVPTMFSNESFNVGRLDELDAKFIELPYESDMKMVIVLPNQIDGLKTVEEYIGLYDLDDIEVDNLEVKLWLPRFKITSDIDLVEPLTQLGMKDVFSEKADLKGISNEQLSIDKVKQKAFIEVNEEGSEAAASTAADAQFRIGGGPPQIHVNRPFYFLIRKSGTTIFQGHVYNPLE